MSRKQRILAYTAAGLATGLLVAGILLYTMSRTEFGMERARRVAIGWLAKRVDGTVHIGSIGGRGLLGGVTLRDFYIIDKLGRPFMRADSAVLAYNWRTLLGGEIVVQHSTLYHPEVYFEKLPGDSIWNYQHVFPSRGAPGGERRLILLRNLRIRNGMAVVRMPYEPPPHFRRGDLLREMLDTLPRGVAKVMRFDSLYGELSRVIWESPIEDGKLIDIRSLSGRGFVWREPMHVRSMRGTVTLRDTIVAFDIPDARLPSSNASLVGRVIMEEGQNFYDVRVDSRSFTFRDLQWLYPRLPDNGGGSGVLRIQSQRPKGTLWLATNTRIAAPGTRLAGSFGIVTGADSLYFTNVDLRASPLNLQLIQTIVPQKLPLKGLLVGTVELKGGLSALDTRGDVQLSDAGGSSGVKWRGRLNVSSGIGARDFRADVDKLDLAVLSALRPDLNLKGRVTGHVEASGNFDRSVKFAADIHHYLSGYTSSFNGSGTYTGGESPALDIQLNALPLSLDELASSYPALERLRGDARGPIRLYGSLDDLAVKADLETLGGRAEIDGRLTRTTEQPRYAGDATLHAFRLDRLISELPETELNGKVSFDVAATAAADATGVVNARLSRGRVRTVEFRDARALMKLERGSARVDTLIARTPLGELNAGGSIGLTPGRSGTLSFTVHTDSIAPLDETDEPANTSGKLRAAGSIKGSVQSFDLNANVDVDKLRVGEVTGDRLTSIVTGSALGSEAGRIEMRGRADSLIAFGVRADTGGFALTYANGKGGARFAAGSQDGSEYIANGTFQTQDGLLFTLDELSLGKRKSWALSRAATLSIDDHGVTIDSMEVRRADGGSVRAAGHIAWHDTSHAPDATELSDFRLDFRGMPFTEFALVTAGSQNVQGTLGGHVRVTGSATAPVLEGDATVSNFALADAKLDQVTGSFTYADQSINARIDAEKGGRRVFFADGVIPVNLAFVPVGERRLANPLRITMQADSMPAMFLTSWVGGFSDVRGRLDGTLIATGTTLKPQLAGAVTLKDGDASWDVTSVRYRDVDGTIKLQSGRLAEVDATVKTNAGSGHVTGTLDFSRLSNPGFDLNMKAQNFLASRRRDVEFTASGDVQLQGHYRQPVVMGAIDVEQGAMFLDELYRRYQIVELDNPLLYDVVDTSLVSLRTILPRTLNPFVKNLIVRGLRVNVGREAWLRSRDLNVEVSGDLTVSFEANDTIFAGERTAQDLVLNGTLRALRGTYQMTGPGIDRQFTIREGTIEFPGTPGVDPNLAFNAVYRARSQRRDPIDIIAVVGGTLRTPRVRLTSDEEPPISESDLASYLFFGAPTYALSATQRDAVAEVTTGAVTSSGFGYLASGLQSFAQNFGLLDYVAVTAADAPGLTTERGIGLLFARTQLELGRYLGQNVYVAVSQRLTSAVYQPPGVRIEWTIMPSLTGEFFVEDRFARSPDFGIQSAATPKRVWGFFVFREWGY